jgi:hypothetical protein
MSTTNEISSLSRDKVCILVNRQELAYLEAKECDDVIQQRERKALIHQENKIMINLFFEIICHHT